MNYPPKLFANVTEDRRIGPAFLSMKDCAAADIGTFTVGDDGLYHFAWYVQAPDATTRDAIQTLMGTHGYTLTPEERAAVRGWLGRTA
jgi:hypothetical protein